MPNMSGIGDTYHWNVSEIVEAFGLHRGTIEKRFLAVNTPVAVTVGGNLVCVLQHVGPALFSVKYEVASSVHDPSCMEPKEGEDWYQSENERIKLEEGQRELVPTSEVVIVYSSMGKAVV